MRRTAIVAVPMLLVICLAGCPPREATAPPPEPRPAPPSEPVRPTQSQAPVVLSSPSLKLTSSAFKDGQPIPARYTADGANVSPPLSWGKVPAEIRELALSVSDMDAPGRDFVHWVVYGIPPTMTGLPEGVRPNASGFEQGLSDFGKPGWGGPDPPPGRTHHYVFRLVGLRDKLYPHSPVDKRELREAVQEHIVTTALLTGTYRR